MGNLGDALKGSLARLGVARQVEAAGVVESAKVEIAKIIPAEDFEVVSYRDGVLKVRVTSSVVANEINLKKDSLMNKDIRRLVIIQR